MTSYPPTAMVLADLLAWAGAAGAGLVEYDSNEPLRHDWQWKFDAWQRATLGLRDFLLTGGSVGLAVINKSGISIPAGPVIIAGWDTTSGKFKISVADGRPALFMLTAALANNAEGTAYQAGEFTSTLDTSGSSVGDAIYLHGDGTIALGVDNALPFDQIVARVKTLHASAGVLKGMIEKPFWRGLANSIGDTLKVDPRFGSLLDSFSTETLNWFSGVLKDLSNQVAVDWPNRQLKDSTGAALVNWTTGFVGNVGTSKSGSNLLDGAGQYVLTPGTDFPNPISPAINQFLVACGNNTTGIITASGLTISSLDGAADAGNTVNWIVTYI